MNAFAKCYVIKNPLQKKAKSNWMSPTTFNEGSLIGQEKIIKNAIKELR